MPDEIPLAWMGYAPREGDRKRPCVRVCAWCPDKAQADALAERHGYAVTHGLCPACYQKQISAQLGESNNES